LSTRMKKNKKQKSSDYLYPLMARITLDMKAWLENKSNEYGLAPMSIVVRGILQKEMDKDMAAKKEKN